MKNFSVENPLYGLSDDQHCQFAQSVGDEASKRFQVSLDQLSTAIREHDPLELLATSAFYCLIRGVGPDTDFTKDMPYPQAVIEVLQSLCLRYEPDAFGITPVLHNPHLSQILETCAECSKDFGLRRFTSLANAKANERSLLMSIESARLHTQIVRNWGYPQHMREIIRNLFEPIDAEVEVRIGLGPLALLDLMDALAERSCNRATEYMSTIGEAFQQPSLQRSALVICRSIGKPEKDANAIAKLMKSKPGPIESKKLFLVSFLHQFLPDIFLFSLDECMNLVPDSVERSALEGVLDQLSYRFGDLATEDPEHLIMQSKIQKRPIIRTDDGEYFLPVHGLANSFFIDIVESLIKPHEDLRKRYHKRRATFLEASLTKMAEEAFPGSLVRPGTTWDDPNDAKTYENDCLVVCGPLALVLEAKSERVDDVAKRGGVKTLRDHYETLVQEPAAQAARLARLLEEGEGTATFQSKRDGEFELDLTTIRRAVCVSVTLDLLPATSLCWKTLVACGLVPEEQRSAVNMSLADLRVVLEVLYSPAVRMHYFWRRIEWEERIEYLGDELDLLVYYLSEGLAIPQTNGDPPSHMLYGNSDELHRYYMAESMDADRQTSRPRRIMTPWWSSIVKRVETIDLPHRWDIACVLLDLDFERQQEFERRFCEAVEAVRQDGNDCGMNGLITYSDHTESIGAVVAFAYRHLPKEERDDRAADLAGQAQKEAGAERVVVIGRDVERLGDPYDFLAFVDPAATKS